MDSKHTWTLEERMLPGHTKPTYFVRPAGDSVAVITKTQGREVAHLVAAAPELLEALQAWQAIYNTRIQDGDTLRDMRLAANQLAETAIAKATERQ